MSIRTVIEINHDYIAMLTAEDWKDIKAFVLASYTGSQHHYQEVQGIRVLGSRHHSETLKLEVK